MSSVLEFSSAAMRQEHRPRPILRGDDVGKFWLDVTHRPSDEPVTVETKHMPRRVLTEAFLVLAGAGLLALTVTQILPGPTF